MWESIELYDNSATQTIASGGKTTRTLSSGFNGMFRDGVGSQATRELTFARALMTTALSDKLVIGNNCSGRVFHHGWIYLVRHQHYPDGVDWGTLSFHGKYALIHSLASALLAAWYLRVIGSLQGRHGRHRFQHSNADRSIGVCHRHLYGGRLH